jgi:beta-lactamase class A
MALVRGRSGSTHRRGGRVGSRGRRVAVTAGAGLAFVTFGLASGGEAVATDTAAPRVAATTQNAATAATRAGTSALTATVLTAPTPPTPTGSATATTAAAPVSATTPAASTAAPSTAAVTSATPPAASLVTTLSAQWQSYLASRPGSVSVALYDQTSGESVYMTKNTRAGWETASTVKLDILAALLSKTDASGQLAAAQLALAKPMISVSDNDAASALWDTAGGAGGMNAFYQSLGMTATTAGSNGYWGLTLTTALDQLQVLRAIAYPGPTLSTNAQAAATSLLDTVVSSQRWGLTAGVPAGVSVEVKNGWLPHGPGWVVDSLAHVHGAGEDYVMAVYTRDSATEAAGIATIAGLSQLAWSTVSAGI